MKKLLAMMLGAALIFTPASILAEEAEAPALQNDLVILFTSDVHCGIERGFGLAGLYQVRKSYENEGKYTLLVDDGDFIQGEPIGTMTKGGTMIDLMNATGYDIAIPGNHEFDYGMDRFLELAGKTQCSYISCNFNHEGELVFEPYVIKEFDGVKFAFVGITTPRTLVSSTPAYFKDEEGNYIYGFFQDETGELLYSKVQEAVDAARAEGADYVIAVAHLGNEAECIPWTYEDIITNTTGIDVILDGHSHDTDQAVVKNKDGKDVIRSACGTKLENIGKVTFKTDGSIKNKLLTWTLDESAPEVFEISNPVTEAVSAATDELNASLAEVVAHTDVDLTIVDPTAVDESNKPIRIIRRAETNLGDLCADAYRILSGADIAFCNGGGIRDNIPAGDITRNNILTVHPYGNLMCVIEVTGQQVLDALEWGARVVPSENGGFLQVSGLSYEIHTYLPNACTQNEEGLWSGHDGEYRVKNVMVGGEPLDLEKTYTLASHNYMLKDNGDGYTMFDGAKILQDEVMLDNQVLLTYITDKLSGVVGEEYENPYGEGRIIAVDEAPAE